ncbi:MAG: hypothetical protein RL538_569 [Candidatus Parcubacteria bacterium]
MGALCYKFDAEVADLPRFNYFFFFGAAFLAGAFLAAFFATFLTAFFATFFTAFFTTFLAGAFLTTFFAGAFFATFFFAGIDFVVRIVWIMSTAISSPIKEQFNEKIFALH